MNEHQLDATIRRGLVAATDEVDEVNPHVLARQLAARRAAAEPAGPPRRPRLLAAAAVVVLAAVGVGIWAVGRDDGVNVVVDQPDTTGFENWATGWHELDTGPVPAMNGASLAWTGERVVVAGTSADGTHVYSFDPAEHIWSELPELRLGQPRIVAADDGTLVVVGDHPVRTESEQRSLGTAPSRRWATLAPGGDEWEGHGEVSATPELVDFSTTAEPRGRLLWTGERVIDAGLGVALDPANGTSEPISMPPDLFAYAYLDLATPVLVGGEVILSIWGTGPGLAWSADGSSWREVPNPTSPVGGTPAGTSTAVADGSDVVLVSSDGGHAGVVHRMDPRSGGVSELPDVPGGAVPWCPHRAGAVGHVVLVQPCGEDGYVEPLRLVEAGWERIGEVPYAEQCCTGTWLGTDEALITWATDTDTTNNARAPHVDAAVWIPGPPSGEVITPSDPVQDPSTPPPGLAAGGALVWTGDEVVVLNGETPDANGKPNGTVVGAAFDPATDTWREIEPSPIEADGRLHAGLTEAGVVVTANQQTAVWDHIADAWRRVDDAPAPVDDLHTQGGLVLSLSAGARLDMATGTWSQLPEPPLAFESLGAAAWAAAWAGDQMVVVGNAGFSPTRAMAFDPSTDTWKLLADPPEQLKSTAATVSWDGSRVLAADYGMVAAAYDPVDDEWTLLPSIPLRSVEDHPRSVSSDGRTVVATWAGAAALQDERWTPLALGPFTSGVLAAIGDGRVAVWSYDRPELTIIDVDELLGSPTVHAQSSSIELSESDELIDARLVTENNLESVELTITTKVGQCVIGSSGGWGQDMISLGDREGQLDRGAPWFRNAPGTEWEAMATPYERLRIECDDAADARRLTESVTVTRRS